MTNDDDDKNEAETEAEATTGRRLRVHVLVHEPVTMTPHTFGPDDEDPVPDWAVPLILRDDVWEGTEPTSVDVDNPGDGMWAWIAQASGMSAEDYTRPELIEYAERLGLEIGTHFNKSADKAVILQAIKHRAEEMIAGNGD